MKRKILVVDDDKDILEPITLLLEYEGYNVATTSKGEKAYTQIKSFIPDLILLDILMSGSDGRSICRKLKEQVETKKIPVIMFSAHPGAKYDAEECGADDFLAKPFELNELLSVVKKYL